MDSQLSLFDNPAAPTPIASRKVSRKTKSDAFKASRDRSTPQAELVLQHIRDAGTEGVTRNELAERSGLRLASVCGRVNELINEDPPRVFQDGRRDGGAVLFAKGSV